MRDVTRSRRNIMLVAAAISGWVAGTSGGTEFTSPNQKPGGAFPEASEVGGDVFIPPIAPGNKIPLDLPVVDVSGKAMTLKETFGGKPVLLNMFLLYNMKSYDEMRALNALAKSHPNISVIGVAIGKVGGGLTPNTPMASTERTLRAIARENDIEYPVYADVKSYSVQSFGLRNAPTTFLVKPNGTVVKVFPGPQQWSSPERMRDIGSVSKN